MQLVKNKVAVHLLTHTTYETHSPATTSVNGQGHRAAEGIRSSYDSFNGGRAEKETEEQDYAAEGEGARPPLRARQDAC